MTASYVRLARVREVLNSVQALRGVPAEGVVEDGARLYRPWLETGGDFPHQSLWQDELLGVEMIYKEVTLKVVVKEDDLDVLVQALNDEMDLMGKLIMVFASAIEEREVGKPENAGEIADMDR